MAPDTQRKFLLDEEKQADNDIYRPRASLGGKIGSAGSGTRSGKGSENNHVSFRDNFAFMNEVGKSSDAESIEVPSIASSANVRSSTAQMAQAFEFKGVGQKAVADPEDAIHVQDEAK